MKKMFAFAIVIFAFASAHADICGIVKTAQGRTASNLIRAQIAQNGGSATIIDDMTMTKMEVTDALVSNKNGADLGEDSRYFDFIVVSNGQRQSVDIGHTYLVINNGQTAVSLNHLTGCGQGVADSRAIIPVP